MERRTVVIDLLSRRAVGWAMSAEMTAQFVTDALVVNRRGVSTPNGTLSR